MIDYIIGLALVLLVAFCLGITYITVEQLCNAILRYYRDTCHEDERRRFEADLKQRYARRRMH